MEPVQVEAGVRYEVAVEAAVSVERKALSEVVVEDWFVEAELFLPVVTVEAWGVAVGGVASGAF